jgi:GNAT superfamily N-acetyltransferase
MAGNFAIFDASTLPIREWVIEASRILSHAMGNPTPQRFALLVADVTGDQPRRHLFLACQDNDLAGAMVIRRQSEATAEIELIAVEPRVRLRGVGRQMVEWARQNLGFRELFAETDGDSVGFYVSCGFTVESLGKLHPSTERFRCRLTS